ncbi:serine/threonine-protein kinase [Agromyces sp. NPDC058110]|uniref:serine/threonine-protein kinase n=1 Tax=Agromyces sp. NPDC058110 TaxID=3346345 RepID=UPI0036DC4E12
MTTSPERVVGDPFIGITMAARYRLDGLVGRGGMAVVYRGEDLVLHRPVAVKVFGAAAEGFDDRDRRASEIALLASLSHRALVRLYDAGHDPATGREFLVMEFVDGRDLRETLRLGPLGPSDAASMLADLAEALHTIHDRGIVHRDIKPANVLLEPAHLPSRTWNAKLADFGIARLIDDARLTSTGLLVGTPGYVSPEQVTGAVPAPPADVYALGLLALEARTRRAAFPGPAAESASARLVRDPSVPPELGDDWVALLRAMTARDPGERPTALEVVVGASALDVSDRTDPATTATTIAFGDTAGPDAVGAGTVGADAADAAGTATVAMTGAAASVADEVTTERMPAEPRYDATGEEPTRVLTAAQAAQPEPTPVTRATPADGPARDRRREGRPARRPARVAMLVLLAAVAATLVWIVVAPLAAPREPAPEPLPSVPGELGVHLEQLDEAVNP